MGTLLLVVPLELWLWSSRLSALTTSAGGRPACFLTRSCRVHANRVFLDGTIEFSPCAKCTKHAACAVWKRTPG